MSTSRKLTVGVAGLAAGATMAGVFLLGAGAAYAAAPPYEPDPSSVGTITFYDATGAVITSGSTSGAPFAAYAVGSVSPRATDKQAQLLFANPSPTATPANWYREGVGNYTAYPLTTGPSNIQTASQTSPVVAGTSGDQTLDGFESDSQISTTAGYSNVVQVRLKTANSANQATTTYDVADLSINPTTHTWTQIYPVVKSATSITTPTSTKNPSTSGDSVTFSSTETAADGTHPTGAIQFFDGSTALGSPVTVSSSGAASYTTSSLSVASHSITAVFTPDSSSSANYSASPASSALTQVVQAPATPTSTALVVTQDGTAGDAATLTASVTGPGSTPNNAGTVSFFDGSSTTPLNSSPVSGTNGTYTLSLPTGFAAGSHSIVAKFTPTSTANFNSSQSAAQTFITQPAATGDCAQTGSSCTDPQTVQVTVPNGTLTITTPYTAQNPLNLGTMTLNTNSTQFSASAPFQNIQVTDTRSGGKGYTVSALSTPLSDGKSNPGSTINAQNVGLTNLAATTSAGFAGTTTLSTNPAASPAVAPGAAGSAGLGGTTPHTVFTAGNSNGTVTVNGTLTINAPTSTEAGIFTGTITFTVA